MSKIIFSSDYHQNMAVLDILLSKEDADYFILGGDFFDSYFTPPDVYSFERTCQYLRWLCIDHPKRNKIKILLGNHDCSYIYRNNRPYNSSVHKVPDYYCSGISSRKVSTFRKFFYSSGLGDEFFLKHFDLALKIDGWIFSHAGIVPQHLPYGSNIDDFIKNDCREAWVNFRNRNHPRNYLLTDVGERRGGECNQGGILWLDFKSEFYASPDIGKQCFGHTHVQTPTVTAIGTNYESWCVDDGQRSYIVIENDKVEIKKYEDLLNKTC